MFGTQQAIDVEKCRARYSYDPETGELTSKKYGKVLKAKGGDKNQYMIVRIDRKVRYQHRVIWAIHYGVDPGDLIIDHVDGDGHNNKIENLRACSQLNNVWNTKTPKGYSYFRGKYMASIRKDGRKIYLGVYDTEAEARQAYLEAATELHGEFLNV